MADQCSTEELPLYEFGSPIWLAAYQGIMSAFVAVAARDEPGLAFSLCELSTDPPAHLGSASQPCGFHCFVRDGRLVRFGAGDASSVDYKVIGSYGVMSELCKLQTGGSADRAGAYRARTLAAWKAGEIRVEGETPRLPRVFGLVHDTVARITL
jgi:hypothetical protein